MGIEHPCVSAVVSSLPDEHYEHSFSTAEHKRHSRNTVISQKRTDVTLYLPALHSQVLQTVSPSVLVVSQNLAISPSRNVWSTTEYLLRTGNYFIISCLGFQAEATSFK